LTLIRASAVSEASRRHSVLVIVNADFGVVKSVAEIWGQHPPVVVRQFVRLMMLFGHSRVRSALRFALSETEEFAL